MGVSLNRLNSRQKKQTVKLLQEQYGYTGTIDQVMFRQPKKDKLYLLTTAIDEIDFSGINIDTMGLYFATIVEGKIRLTIEGTQLIGPKATKNVIEITKEQMQNWLLGEKLEPENTELPAHGTFVILKHGTDYLGCGKISGRVISNYIPKTRYVHALYE